MSDVVSAESECQMYGTSLLTGQIELTPLSEWSCSGG